MPNKVNGYFTTIKNSARRAVERGYKINKNNVMGLGTIYAWDFAFVKTPNIKNIVSNIGGNEPDTSYFRYIGQAAQISTIDRIGEHVNQAISGKGERKMYAALGTALKNDYAKSESFPDANTIKSGDEKIVRVVQVASLFDLKSLESNMIKQDNLTNPEASTFEELVNTSGLRGLNQLAAGVGAERAGTKSAGEIISAAFFYLTEDDNKILAARTNDMPVADIVLNKTNKDYVEATKEIFKAFGLGNIYAVDSKAFDTLVRNFYKKIGGKFQRGLQVVGENKLLDITQKFGNPELKIFFNYVDLNEQIVKGIFFKFAMSEDSITESNVKALAKKANDIQNEKISKPAMLTKIAKIFINAMYQAGVASRSQGSLKQPPLNKITDNITSNLSVLPIKINGDKVSFFAERPILQERKMEKAGNLNYISAKDQYLIEQIISGYCIEYYNVLGYLPTPSEISNILGYFSGGNAANVSKKLQETGLSKKEADKLAKQITIQSEWTRK